MEGYYDEGMKVPDDAILLWSDDKCVLLCWPLTTPPEANNSWGNVRRNPLPSERNRTGGSGVYYHVRALVLP